MEDSGEFVCSHCLIPVRAVPQAKQLWTKGSEQKRWFHQFHSGTCGRQFLYEDDIEEAGDPRPAEVPVQD